MKFLLSIFKEEKIMNFVLELFLKKLREKPGGKFLSFIKSSKTNKIVNDIYTEYNKIYNEINDIV